MKKKFKILLVLAVAVIAAAAAGIYVYQDHLYADTLSNSRRQQALTAFAEKDGCDPSAYTDTEPDKVAGRIYLGTFNGYDIFYSEGNDLSPRRWSIAGVEFYAESKFIMYVHKNGKLVYLDDAYREGYLSVEDLSQIEDNFTSRDDIPSIIPTW